MTVIPYSTTPAARANAARATATARATASRPIDRLLISAGTALAEWGVRRAARHPLPDFGDQTAAFEARRETAARILPMLPR
jgi:hypothetical protein